MEEIKLTGIPETIEQAVETLTKFYAESLPKISKMSLEAFEASAHYGARLFIRNSWHLWWYEGHYYDGWPREKPALVKYFNDLGIVESDYMSTILMNCFYQKVHSQLIENRAAGRVIQGLSWACGVLMAYLSNVVLRRTLLNTLYNESH